MLHFFFLWRLLRARTSTNSSSSSLHVHVSSFDADIVNLADAASVRAAFSPQRNATPPLDPALYCEPGFKLISIVAVLRVRSTRTSQNDEICTWIYPWRPVVQARHAVCVEWDREILGNFHS